MKVAIFLAMRRMKKKGVKISIVGAGFVGSTTAYALMMGGLASDIVIVDLNKKKAEGEAMDLSHGTYFVKPVNITSGDYEDTKDSDIVIITAGAAQKPGETRIDLVNKNVAIFKSIVKPIVEYSPNCIIIVVSNPVDILSYITYKISGFPSNRVIGTGTVLDTSRFRYMLSSHLDIDVRNVHTYILGEHGDSEIAAWSLTNVAGMGIDAYCEKVCKHCDSDFKYSVYEDVKNSAYQIIDRKGSTYYAIALATKRIVESILRDEKSIFTTSSLLKGEYGIDDMYLGVPSIIGINGLEKVIDVPLEETELEALRNSAKTLKEVTKDLDI